MTASGAPDPKFGAGGLAPLDLQSSCGGGAPAALAPDGSIVITGNVGQASPGIASNPDAGSTFQWVVRRLTAGANGPVFGTIPVSGPRRRRHGRLQRRSCDPPARSCARHPRPPAAARRADRDGAPDPSFNGGPLAPCRSMAFKCVAPRRGDRRRGNRQPRPLHLHRRPRSGLRHGRRGLVQRLQPRLRSAGDARDPGRRDILTGSAASSPRPLAQPRLQVQRVTPSGTLGGAGTLTPHSAEGSPAGAQASSTTASAAASSLAPTGLPGRRQGERRALHRRGRGLQRGLRRRRRPDPAAHARNRLRRTPAPRPGPGARAAPARQSAAELRRVLARVRPPAPGSSCCACATARPRARAGRSRGLRRGHDNRADRADDDRPAHAPPRTSVRVRVERDFRDVLTARDRGVVSTGLRYRDRRRPVAARRPRRLRLSQDAARAGLYRSAVDDDARERWLDRENRLIVSGYVAVLLVALLRLT